VFIDKPATALPSVDFWRSLFYFNLFRLTLACFFVILSGVFGAQLNISAHHLLLFFGTSVIYLLLTIASLIVLRLHWPRFNIQLAWQVGVDIVAITVFNYVSGGIQSNVALLLLVPLASAGMISRGKITLFFSALASIAALLSHTYSVLYANAEASHFVQVGLLCAAYFVVAWLAHTLARYAVDSQKLAQRRGRDLVSLSEANRLVMRDMQDGVLVIDGRGMIMQMNHGAERLMRRSVSPGSALQETFPLLFNEFMLWKQTGDINRNIVQLDEKLQARLRFVQIEGERDQGSVIFLEDMRRVRAEAQQIKLAALGRLTANIAHEVRNPLSAISHATELLQEEKGDDRQQRLLKIVLDNSKRINQIVHDVMQLNRRDRAQSEVFRLDVVLRNFIEEFCMAEGRELQGTVILQGLSDVEVAFDRGHLHQVLSNLCSNALRYFHKTPGSLNLTIALVGHRTVLDVQDDGPGISEEKQGQLFEPFFTTESDGTGLGLYIAKELCEANGAQLEYHVNDKQGACFRITFGDVSKEGEGIKYGE